MFILGKGLTIYNICTFILVDRGVRNANVIDPRASFESKKVDLNGTSMKKHSRDIDEDFDKGKLNSVALKSEAESVIKQKASTEEPYYESTTITKSDSFEDYQKNFDEIVPESEVVNTLTEKKEPNGKSYFIDRKNSEENALELLDSVILNEAQNLGEMTPSLPIEVSLSEFTSYLDKSALTDIETVATVHREIGSPLQDDSPSFELTVKQITDDSDSGILMNSHNSLNEPKPSDIDIESEFNDEIEKKLSNIAVLPLEEKESQPIVGEKLKPLLLVSNEENIETANPKTIIVNGTKTLPLRNEMESKKQNAVKESKSESDLRSLLFAEIKKLKKPEEIVIKEKDEDMFTDSDFLRRPNKVVPVEVLSPTIPAPPAFDPVKFEGIQTIPRPHLKIVPIKQKKRAPSPPAPKKMKSPTVLEEKTPETLTPHSTNFASFKDRLEAIYSRGPPSPFAMFNKPSKPKPSSNPETPEAEPGDVQSPTETDNEMQSYKLNTKPFDTVHKQKAIFNDVLKSINPDTRPSIIRNESMNKTK